MTRIALITGGNRGLGRAAALALAEDDTDAIVTYRSNADEAGAVVAELQARGRTAAALPLDTTDAESYPAFEESVRDALQREWGRTDLDILINNAGFSGVTRFGQTDPAVMDDLYRVHVRGPVLLTERLAPLVADGGRILFVSSGLTTRTNPLYSVYASMKGAIEVYTRYTAAVLGSRRITVNVIAPGATATDFGDGLVRDDAGYRERIASSSAFGRVGEADDIGRAIALIVSADAGWITAQRLEASGGQGL